MQPLWLRPWPDHFSCERVERLLRCRYGVAAEPLQAPLQRCLASIDEPGRVGLAHSWVAIDQAHGGCTGLAASPRAVATASANWITDESLGTEWSCIERCDVH